MAVGRQLKPTGSVPWEPKSFAGRVRLPPSPGERLIARPDPANLAAVATAVAPMVGDAHPTR